MAASVFNFVGLIFSTNSSISKRNNETKRKLSKIEYKVKARQLLKKEKKNRKPKKILFDVIIHYHI